MKKFLIFVLLAVAGYFAYENFIKEKEVYEIKDSYNKSRASVDLDAPALSPTDYAHYQGTIKNISDKTLTNITITYLIDAKESKAEVASLAPGETIDFKTTPVMLRNMDAAHYLKEVTYDGK